MKWRVGKGRMPDPSEFDWWIFLYKRITLPALRQMLTFRPGQKKNSKGRIVLSESGDLRYATFLYSKKRASKYLIGPDEIKWASRLNGDGETYDRFTFLALLGSKPTSIKYSFTKKAIKGNMISLGNIDGTTLVLRFASLALPVTEGNSFFIEVERYDSSLRFKCYKSSESKTLYAMGLIALNKGFPICQSVSMRSPAEA